MTPNVEAAIHAKVEVYMKILIVEDDNMIREGISEFLLEFGYTVIQAKDGREALSKFNTSSSFAFTSISSPFILAV